MRKPLAELDEIDLLPERGNEAMRPALKFKLILGAYALGQAKRFLVRYLVLAEVELRKE